MILVDTPIWIDHLRRTDLELVRLLGSAEVLTHPFVIGEIALGYVKQRARVLKDLAALPGATVASDGEVIDFIASAGLAGTGIGYIDAHLLAAVKLTPGAALWTRDKRLATVAKGLGLSG